MVKVVVLLAFLLSATISPVLAVTRIASLGEGPLIGEIRSTDDLAINVARDQPRIAKAARLLGLSDAQFQEFWRDIDDRQNIRWVTIPRHLEAMSSESAGRVHIIRDVVIPANTKGWAVYLHDSVTVYVPQRCGNLSILHRPGTAVAATHVPAAPRVAQTGASRPVQPPIAALAPPVAPPPPVAPAPPDAALAPPIDAAPAPLDAAPVAAASPGIEAHRSLLGLAALLAPIIAAFANGSGGGGGGGIGGVGGGGWSFSGGGICP